MAPHRGDVWECPSCLVRLQILSGAQGAEGFTLNHFACVCGDALVLIQSGSESTVGSRKDLLQAVSNPERLM